MNSIFNLILVILLYFSAYQSLLAHGSHRHGDEPDHKHEASEVSNTKKEFQATEQRIKDLETYLEYQGISVETSQTRIKLGGAMWM